MDNHDLGLTGSKWAHGNSHHAMGTGLLSGVEARQPIFEQRLQGAHQTGRLLLLDFPNHTKFSNNKFWSQASIAGNVLSCGFKMKWHNLGERRIQLRLPVGLGFPERGRLK
jgi:hypothetical protein